MDINEKVADESDKYGKRTYYLTMIIAGASEANRDQISRLLASSGYPVYRCCSSESSLRRALAESEDCILIFVGTMPDCTPDDLVWDYGDRMQILWIAKPSVLENCESAAVFRLPVPVSGQTIVGALDMLSQLHQQKKNLLKLQF